MRWIIRYLFPNEPECESCNHKSFCDEGIPNCATHSPMQKPSKSIRILVMSFNPAIKKFSRPVIEQPTSPNIWEYTGIMLSGIMVIALTAAFEVAAK